MQVKLNFVNVNVCKMVNLYIKTRQILLWLILM